MIRFLSDYLPSRRDRMMALLLGASLVNPLSWLLHPIAGLAVICAQYLYALDLIDWVVEGHEHDSGPPSAGRDDDPIKPA